MRYCRSSARASACPDSPPHRASWRITWQSLILIVLLGSMVLAACGTPAASTEPASAAATATPAGKDRSAKATAVAVRAEIRQHKSQKALPSPTPAVAEEAAATPTPAPAVAANVPSFGYAPCPMDVPPGATVDCGYLEVLEDRSNPAGRTIRLAVAIIRSPAGDARQPDPIIYLEGGPGGTALYGLDDWIDTGYNGNRDVVVLAQRGTGFSEPDLNCSELNEMSDTTALWVWRRYLDTCRRRLESTGTNLSMYNSAASAADVEELRQVLGYDQINLLGISYGTRLALTIMRDHPTYIRSAVLDSPYPPNVDIYTEDAFNSTRAFSVLFADCAADPACNAAYPNLEQVFYSTVERLNSDPAYVTLTDFESGEPYRAALFGDDLIAIVFQLLYNTAVIPEIPALIYDVSEGNYDLLVELAQLQGFRRAQDEADMSEPDGDSEGMFFSVQCHEEMPFTDYESVAAAAAEYPYLENYVITGYEDMETICEIWGVTTAQPIENEPVVSDIPTLILVGEYDPVTPPEWGQVAAQTLSNSYLYELPAHGHAVSVLGGCPTALTQAFLNNPFQPPDASCVGSLGPRFAVP